jgi:protein-disulfide isomerase
VVVVGLLIFLNRPRSAVDADPFVPVARAQVSGRVAGDPAAPVRIVEYADFQCPFCQRFAHETEPRLYEEFIAAGVVSLEYRDLAFLGPESVRAAEAAECANEQGFFWDYHDILFQRQGVENSGAFSDENLKRFAREMAEALPGRSWDQEAFVSCLDSGRMRPVVEQMVTEAAALGIHTTPSFLVNGALITGAQPIDVFRGAIESARGSAP